MSEWYIGNKSPFSHASADVHVQIRDECTLPTAEGEAAKWKAY